MIYTYLATAILSAGLAFTGGWQVNQWRFDSAQKHSIEAAAVAQREFHALEQARSRAALDAQTLARKSESRLRADAAASQSALVGLQHATADALRAAGDNLETCLAVSAATSELFLDSSRAYRELATQADGHVIDLRVQIDSP